MRAACYRASPVLHSLPCPRPLAQSGGRRGACTEPCDQSVVTFIPMASESVAGVGESRPSERHSTARSGRCEQRSMRPMPLGELGKTTRFRVRFVSVFFFPWMHAAWIGHLRTRDVRNDRYEKRVQWAKASCNLHVARSLLRLRLGHERIFLAVTLRRDTTPRPSPLLLAGGRGAVLLHATHARAHARTKR